MPQCYLVTEIAVECNDKGGQIKSDISVCGIFTSGKLANDAVLTWHERDYVPVGVGDFDSYKLSKPDGLLHLVAVSGNESWEVTIEMIEMNTEFSMSLLDPSLPSESQERPKQKNVPSPKQKHKTKQTATSQSKQDPASQIHKHRVNGTGRQKGHAKKEKKIQNDSVQSSPGPEEQTQSQAVKTPRKYNHNGNITLDPLPDDFPDSACRSSLVKLNTKEADRRASAPVLTSKASTIISPPEPGTGSSTVISNDNVPVTGASNTKGVKRTFEESQGTPSTAKSSNKGKVFVKSDKRLQSQLRDENSPASIIAEMSSDKDLPDDPAARQRELKRRRHVKNALRRLQGWTSD